MFYPFSIEINKCSSKCNNINNPYAKICVPDTLEDLNVRDQIKLFVIVNKDGMKINVDVNVKN